MVNKTLNYVTPTNKKFPPHYLARPPLPKSLLILAPSNPYIISHIHLHRKTRSIREKISKTTRGGVSHILANVRFPKPKVVGGHNPTWFPARVRCLLRSTAPSASNLTFHARHTIQMDTHTNAY
ncbi:hypothetical protein JTE90_005568 [Oedothorax gibbosus]|uniref:Uncharacterized protein n=1 Tax=Oedothorax gibbosus TaxID=931172 RepID=A0AAV6VA88_9ARAC|nr:hypothetical protein JTE90_005568 [Oedothorax gibbosus]